MFAYHLFFFSGRLVQDPTRYPDTDRELHWSHRDTPVKVALYQLPGVAIQKVGRTANSSVQKTCPPELRNLL